MKYDIVIIGAGPAGLSFARSLGETSLKVLLVERSSLTTLREPPEDGREIALTHLSVEMMKASGAWQQLADKDVSPICAAKFWMVIPAIPWISIMMMPIWMLWVIWCQTTKYAKPILRWLKVSTMLSC